MYNCEFKWPNGEYIAVVFNISWETWPKILGTPENHQRTAERVPPGAKYRRGMRWIYEHAHGETGGMQRLLDIWQRHEIPTSVYADGLLVDLYPDLARAVRDGGHEFLVQGWDHEYLWAMTAQQQAVSIDRTIEVFDKELGVTATGFSCPGGHLTPESFEIVADRGFSYICGMRNTDLPFIIPVGDRKLVGMNSYHLCDYNCYGHSDNTARQVIEAWRDYFEALYDEGRRGYPMMLAYGTHPYLSWGYRTWPMEELIRDIKSRDGVWITTRGEIAAYMHENYPEHYLSTFYPEAAASDRHYGLGIGLGGEEARAEAMSYRVE